MRGLVGAAVVVAACGGSPRAPAPAPAPIITEPPAPKRTKPLTVAMVRPDIGIEALLPNFADVLRWPLGPLAHAAFEPQFPIAKALAENLTWRELCDRGVQKRVATGKSDHVAYLRAWCGAESDADRAVQQLLSLSSSAVPGLAAAARLDIPTIIANTGDAVHADGVLARNHVRDPSMLDVLAATYAELGKLDDARELNARALTEQLHATETDRCTRLVRDAIFRGNDWEHHRIELEALAKRSSPCSVLVDQIACRREPGFRCHAYFAGLEPSLAYRRSLLLTTYFEWPERGTFSQWLYIAQTAIRAAPVEGAVELAKGAYSAALAVAPTCTSEVKEEMRRKVAALENSIGAIGNVMERGELARLEQRIRECAMPRVISSEPKTNHIQGWRL